jgi:hypothetical protein
MHNQGRESPSAPLFSSLSSGPKRRAFSSARLVSVSASVGRLPCRGTACCASESASVAKRTNVAAPDRRGRPDNVGAQHRCAPVRHDANPCTIKGASPRAPLSSACCHLERSSRFFPALVSVSASVVSLVVAQLAVSASPRASRVAPR